MSTITRRYAVSGMHCGSCAMSIDWELEDMDGVVEARTSFATCVTSVTLDPQRASDDAILAAIARAGFVATPL
jgi:copper chaperone CopZ